MVDVVHVTMVDVVDTPLAAGAVADIPLVDVVSK